MRLWYLRHYLRLLIPYWIVTFPYAVYRITTNGNNIVDVLLYLTGMDFFLKGSGYWFISAIIVLYAFAPILYCLFNKIRYNMFFAILLSLAISTICQYEDMPSGPLGNLAMGG